MEQIFTVLLAIAALAIGYYIGYLMQRKRVDELDEAVSEAKDELNFAQRQAKNDVAEERDKAEQAEAKLQNQAAEWQKARSKLMADLQDLRSKMQTAEDVWVGSSEEIASREKSLQSAENKIEAMEADLADAQQAVTAVQQQLQQAEEQNAFLAAQQVSAPAAAPAPASAPGAGLDPAAVAALFADAGDNLNEILAVVANHQAQETVVVSDTNGIVVAASGEKEHKDGMAATTQLVDDLTRQLDGLVPFSKLAFYCLQDSDAKVITGKSFHCAGEALGLATYGDSQPESLVLDEAMVRVKAVLD